MMPTLVKMTGADKKEYEQLSDKSQKPKSQSVDHDDGTLPIMMEAKILMRILLKIKRMMIMMK